MSRGGGGGSSPSHSVVAVSRRAKRSISKRVSYVASSRSVSRSINSVPSEPARRTRAPELFPWLCPRPPPPPPPPAPGGGGGGARGDLTSARVSPRLMETNPKYESIVEQSEEAAQPPKRGVYRRCGSGGTAD